MKTTKTIIKIILIVSALVVLFKNLSSNASQDSDSDSYKNYNNKSRPYVAGSP